MYLIELIDSVMSASSSSVSTESSIPMSEDLSTTYLMPSSPLRLLQSYPKNSTILALLLLFPSLSGGDWRIRILLDSIWIKVLSLSFLFL